MLLSIKEFSQKTNVSEYTLRFYEKEGVLPFVNRTDSGRRVYNEQNLEWIEFITALRETGMSLSEIKRYVNLYKQGNSTIPERKQMMLDHKAKVQKQLSQTLKYLEKVNYKLALYDVMLQQVRLP
ncbi:MAG TPA: MerR family transcriptional regulator [Ruminococcaceae bacterium]|mgnify:FL=1|jgi:DNA-binding transcriptional MerR regulator|nr:MerR family transcriptional regulator [Oscillospiraceae bacterium]HBQ46286.1 MerR family transcriptional regulator [Oscillospiraceae bacterium]HBT91197.1 MerR family transcriptional regulator [Oscillospiraceae bacterium]HCB92088.1 MerR family transcriptional regulator [Oscillospiraceae bacterium]